MPGLTQLAESLQTAIDQLTSTIAALPQENRSEEIVSAQERACKALRPEQRYLFDSLTEALPSSSEAEFKNPDTREPPLTT
jgi:hypothetical protein